MLKVDSISFAYDGRPVLKDVSFKLTEGELTSLLGVNGSGKTTLLKVISNLIKPIKGCVTINDRSIDSLQDLAKVIAYIPQKTNAIACSVFDAVLMGRRPHIGIEATRRDYKVVEDLIGLLHLEELAFKLTTELSGGELQKVTIARALAQEPKILLLDEPISHLDIKNQLEVMGLIKTITLDMQIVTLSVLHDLNIALRFSDRFVMLKDGRVYAEGYQDTVTEDTIEEVFGVRCKISSVEGFKIVIPYSKGFEGF